MHRQFCNSKIGNAVVTWSSVRQALAGLVA
jgi:hypothetical protein